MKKFTLTYLAFLLLTLNAQAVKVKFTTANMSVNVAEGTISIFTSFELFPDDFENTDSLNAIDFVDFPNLSYNNIVSVSIEKAMLSTENTPNFSRLANFIITDSTNGHQIDNEILQGSTYVYRLSVTDKNGQEFHLLNRELTPQLANPTINCAKLNNVYRLAGHNTYQTSVAFSLYFSLFYTRVLELDVWSTNNSTTWNWGVAHTSSSNNNNCRSGNQPFGICIDEIKRWHNNHPNHDVIVLFIDLKSDWNYSKGQTPADLDFRLLSLVPNPDMIYKPRDLIGNNFGNMRAAAQLNNWPSMGDLTGKLMFVLTGDGSRVSEYIADRSLDAVAFSAARVNNNNDVNDLTRSTPSIGIGLENDIVFYNMQHFCNVPFNIGCGSDANLNTGLFTSNLNYVNRTYGIGTTGQPGHYSNSEYNEAINFNMNNIAVGNIDGNFNPAGKPINGIQWMPDVTFPGLVNNHIYSNYQNVTQAAINNIVANGLTVEPDAYYRMVAGNSIDLQSNVDIKEGSNVDIRIDDCRYTNYNQRQNMQTGEQLTQEEIDAMMHQLNKELYGYQPESEKEIIHLTVYPNPTSNLINISYTQFLSLPSTFTLFDITGRIVKTQNYTPQNEGKQQISFSVAQLKEGTYFYTLQVGEQTYNGKVMKIK
ncbi:MAG: Ca2+-dependent phosphoinositide-specific phospholipase C [Vicingaceae bacterium]|nr:Ca2+-dependent phosphoinositide-specific phospholipase C [Vicingaceae bacterium]